jgi:hypothetical protein
MKYKLPLTICIILSFIVINGCSGKVNNSITLKNLAMGTVYFNFRGDAIPVAAQSTAIVQEIPKGTYKYDTTFLLPVGATTGTATGAVKGDLTIMSGTRIAIVYSATLINGAYALYATISTSDDQGTTTGP